MKRPIRRAFTLIEMVVVITLVAGLAIALGMLLTSLMHLDRAERKFLSEAVALDRLAFELRRDARDAIDAKPGDGKVDLIEPAGAIVSYRAEKARIVRLETRDESEVRREVFNLTPTAHAFWEIEKAEGLKILKMSIVFGSKNAIKRYPFRVDATLGASRRFEAKESDASSR